MYSEYTVQCTVNVHIKGPKVPVSESPREREGLGAKGLGRKSAWERTGWGTIVVPILACVV